MSETEEQFQDTLKLMEEVKFDSVNTAAYSPRPNTPAAVWENQVDDDRVSTFPLALSTFGGRAEVEEVMLC